MTMLGMQADMQFHCFTGYCSSSDFNLNATSSVWSSNNGDKILKNEHYCNGHLAPPATDQYLTYKDKLKQTMLQHEALFKDQIHELHRLYNRQRELMDEMKRTKLYGHHLQLETSQSNTVFSETSLEYHQKTCKVSALPWMNPACGQSSFSVAENNHSNLNYVEGKIIQAGYTTALNDGHGKESGLLGSRCKKVGNKILDLELPGHEYIDSEPEESLVGEAVPLELPGYPLKSIVAVQKSDVEFSHGFGDGNLVFQDDNMTQTSFSRKTNWLADLNVPIKLEEETNLESSDFLVPASDHREIPCLELSEKRNSDFQAQPKETVQTTQAKEDSEAFSNVLYLDKNGNRHKCLSDNDKGGQNNGDINSIPKRMCSEILSTSAAEDEVEQAYEISTPRLVDLNNGKLESKSKDFGSESYLGQLAADCKYISRELITLDDMNFNSSLVSFGMKHTRDFVRAPVAVQALPCFRSPVHLSRRSKLRSSQIVGDKSSHGINIESKPISHCASSESSFCSGDDKFATADSGTKKHVKSSVDQKLTRHIDLNSMSPNCSSYAAAHSIWIADEEEKCQESVGGFPLCGSNLARPAKSDKKLDLNCNYVPDLGEQLTANDLVLEHRHDKMSPGFGFFVDLNSCTDEDESLQMLCMSKEIDLHAPASPENKETSPPRGESDENQVETPCQLPGQENGDLLEDLMTAAAEAIVSISSQVETYTETLTLTLKPSEASGSDSLYWFAKIASTTVDDPEGELGIVLSFKENIHHDGDLNDGIDYFEEMTLKLKEMKVEECFSKARIQMEEATCPVTLPSQPRRGRTRRARQQRKDFQSEILPSLASLSRYEVTEDLQVIGGLIEAAHQSTGARRTGAHGHGCTRGRRRRLSISSSKAESSVCVLLKRQNKQGECSGEERSLIDWGKITRRRRGQRCPASNPRLILGQV